mgnify:CR=1 FL=1
MWISFRIAAPRAAMHRLAFAASDLTPLMDLIGTVLVNGAVERIGQTNVAPDGTPWPKSLRAQLEEGVTLHDSGQLMRSISMSAVTKSFLSSHHSMVSRSIASVTG